VASTVRAAGKHFVHMLYCAYQSDCLTRRKRSDRWKWRGEAPLLCGRRKTSP